MNATSPPSNHRGLLKIAIVVVLAAIVLGIWFSPLRAHLNRDEIRVAVGQLRDLWYGPIVFVLGFAASCVIALPASIFVLSAGVIWGWKLGTVYTLAGGLLGATASYFVGRFLGEGVLERFGRVGRLVTRQVDHAGFKSLLVLRLIPGIPFAVLNYGAGVARVALPDYIGATAIGMLPSVIVFTYCADALFSGTMTEGDALRRLAIVGALMIAMVLLPVVLKRFVRTPTPDESA
jgi:uncharacterized membrane protein YdjX (TVP38/TMEM64 family)